MARRTFFFSMLLMMVSGCLTQTSENQRDVVKKYFDLEGLVEDQISILDSLNPDIVKKAEIDDASEQKELGNIDWEKELKLFRNADLNKPKLLDLYEVKTSDVENQKKYTEYKNISEDPDGVVSLKIFGKRNTELPSRIEIDFIEKNTLYFSRRHMILYLEGDQDGQARITRYTIQGIEKILLGDSIRFALDASIAY
ncbi:hypothetical protein QQ008_11590 [Fulvivirgaceae bacterium BMA10]|uniref:Lipoprotein n=1 Tax=Splendidivirga corallicola TaxID=3051826 RepID=A0ABT8KMQ8_9BACT|nr:hypothetical protein [Fulvivirgaceae bacterium BMA10]